MTDTPDAESTAIDEVETKPEAKGKHTRDPATDTVDESTAAESDATADAEPDGTSDVTSDVEPEATADVDAQTDPPTAKRFETGRVLAFGVLPVVLVLLALVAGYLKYMDGTASGEDTARTESVQAAKDITVNLLSYQPQTVEQQLTDARSQLTGEFKKSYTDLTTAVVIPGAKEKQISAVATVPRAASVSADDEHAVALVFVNQTVVVGNDAPTASASSVKVTLEKVDGKWLISGFDPI